MPATFLIWASLSFMVSGGKKRDFCFLFHTNGVIHMSGEAAPTAAAAPAAAGGGSTETPHDAQLRFQLIAIQ